MPKQHEFSFDIHGHVVPWKSLLLLFAKLRRMPNHACNTPEHLNAKGVTKSSFPECQGMGEIPIRYS